MGTALGRWLVGPAALFLRELLGTGGRTHLNAGVGLGARRTSGGSCIYAFTIPQFHNKLRPCTPMALGGTHSRRMRYVRLSRKRACALAQCATVSGVGLPFDDPGKPTDFTPLRQGFFCALAPSRKQSASMSF
jgi:hypothetical protein